MELTEYTRKQFAVKAVEVTLKNVDEVADWCGGTVEMVPTPMMGTKALLPTIKIQGVGSRRGTVDIAILGSFVVALGGSFRVYKPKQFEDTFEAVLVDDSKETAEPDEEGDCEPGTLAAIDDPETFLKVI